MPVFTESGASGYEARKWTTGESPVYAVRLGLSSLSWKALSLTVGS